jgi:hypothetical protein
MKSYLEQMKIAEALKESAASLEDVAAKASSGASRARALYMDLVLTHLQEQVEFLKYELATVQAGRETLEE